MFSGNAPGKQFSTQSKEGLSDPTVQGGRGYQVVTTSPQGKGHSHSLVREMSAVSQKAWSLWSLPSLTSGGSQSPGALSISQPALPSEMHSPSLCFKVPTTRRSWCDIQSPPTIRGFQTGAETSAAGTEKKGEERTWHPCDTPLGTGIIQSSKSSWY